MNINMKVTKKKKKGKEGGFHLALASLHTNIIKLCLSNFIVIFSQFFHTHCRVPLFVANVSTCIVNRMGYCRKKENVLLEEQRLVYWIVFLCLPQRFCMLLGKCSGVIISCIYLIFYHIVCSSCSLKIRNLKCSQLCLKYTTIMFVSCETEKFIYLAKFQFSSVACQYFWVLFTVLALLCLHFYLIYKR